MKVNQMIRACLCVTLVAFCGCSQALTDAFFAETVADSRRFHELTRKNVDAHDANMTEQHKAMSPEAAAAIDALRSEFEAKSAELQKRSDEIHSSVGENTKELVATGLRLASRFAGLPDGAAISGVLTETVDAETGALAQVLDTKTGVLNTAMLTSFKEVNREMSDEAKARAAALEAVKKDLESKLAQLTEETRSKLAGTTEETRAKLDGLVNDRQQFEKVLRDELKLTPAELETLKGMTTEEILALIAAAGGAAGLGIAGGRGGKSRSHADVENLKAEVAKLSAAAPASKST